MPFKIDDTVIHPNYGMGRIAALVMKRFTEAEASLYYEIAIQRGTVWAPVEGSASAGLRPLTPKEKLDHYRGILRGRPLDLIPDARQRHMALITQLKVGSFQVMCEVVRDLTARGWIKALNEIDGSMLRKTRDGLCQEWAAAEGVSIGQATEEVEGLLREGRHAHQPTPR